MHYKMKWEIKIYPAVWIVNLKNLKFAASDSAADDAADIAKPAADAAETAAACYWTSFTIFAGC